MNSSKCHWAILCALGVAIGFGSPVQAQDKKPAKSDDRVIIIQIDASKIPPDVLKKLLESAKVDEKKPVTEEKKPATKAEVKKPNIVQVDLNKLPPDLAKRLSAELNKTPAKSDEKKPNKKDDDDDDEKGKKGDKKKEDDNKNNQQGNQNEDGKKGKGKGKKEDDDDKKGDKKKGEKDE